jgi:ABC-2 type transport system permease protein
MRRSQVWSIALKDLADFRTSKYAFYTLLVPPLVFGLLLPLVYLVPFQAELGPRAHDLDLGGLSPVNGSASGLVLDHVRGSLLVNVRLVDCVVVGSNLAGNTTATNTTLINSSFIDREDPDEALIAFVFFNLLLLMLMIIPSMVPTVLASYSLVGEKTNGSLEPLLATPSTDGEVLGGKVVAILLPTLAVCWAGALLTLVVVNVAGGELIARHPVPLDAFGAACLLFVPAFGLLSILANVVISSRVSDVRAAQQMGGFVVLPVVILFIGSIGGVGTMGAPGILAASALVAAGDAGLAFVCLRLFRREEILVRWK